MIPIGAFFNRRHTGKEKKGKGRGHVAVRDRVRKLEGGKRGWVVSDDTRRPRKMRDGSKILRGKNL